MSPRPYGQISERRDSRGKLRSLTYKHFGALSEKRPEDRQFDLDFVCEGKFEPVATLPSQFADCKLQNETLPTLTLRFVTLQSAICSLKHYRL